MGRGGKEKKKLKERNGTAKMMPDILGGGVSSADRSINS